MGVYGVDRMATRTDERTGPSSSVAQRPNRAMANQPSAVGRCADRAHKAGQAPHRRRACPGRLTA